jgi:hypothetical protein
LTVPDGAEAPRRSAGTTRRKWPTAPDAGSSAARLYGKWHGLMSDYAMVYRLTHAVGTERSCPSSLIKPQLAQLVKDATQAAQTRVVGDTEIFLPWSAETTQRQLTV